MFRLWGKIWKDNHLLQDTVICNDTDDTRTHKIFQALDEICYEFDNKHEHGVYLNWLKHNEFTEDDFFDADHLNEYGAEKLTKMLDEYIMSWQ